MSQISYKPARQITHLLIAGSHEATPQMLDYARKVVRHAHAKGFTILVGDNWRGVDMAVVRECRRLKVPVIVTGAGNFPRNGGCKHGSYIKVHRDTYRGANGYLLNRYTVRDRWLVDNAQMGIFIWNGESPDTEAAFNYMHSRGKACWLKQFPQAVRHG